LNDRQAVRQDLTSGEYSRLVSDPLAGPNTETLKRLYGVGAGRWTDMQAPDHGRYADDLQAGLFKTGDESSGNVDMMGKVKEAAMSVMLDTYDEALQVPTWELYQEKIANDKQAQGYDSFELFFDVTSCEPIADAQAVIWARITTPDNPEGNPAVFHERIGRLDTSPHRVRVRKAGLPAGFQLTDITVQVRAHGIELGSNLSERSQSLTNDEARGFLLLAHLADHKQETLAAQPVWELAPAELWAAAHGQAFDYPVVVSLNEHGQVMGVHTTTEEARASLQVVDADEIRSRATSAPLRGVEDLAAANPPRTVRELDQSGRIPDRITDLVSRTTFMPALAEGVPVASYITVNLADFFR